MPAARLAVLVGKNAQKRPGAASRSSGAAHQIGTSSPSSSDLRSARASLDSRWVHSKSFHRVVVSPSTSRYARSSPSNLRVRLRFDSLSSSNKWRTCLYEQEEVRREVTHLLDEAIDCTGLERKPHNVRSPLHQHAQNGILFLLRAWIDRFGQAESRVA